MGEQASPIKYFLCGGFGGVCTVITGHPLDTIKVTKWFVCSDFREHSPNTVFHSGATANDAFASSWSKATLQRYLWLRIKNHPKRRLPGPIQRLNNFSAYAIINVVISGLSINSMLFIWISSGMTAPLTGVAPIFAMSFFGFGLGKRLQQKNEEPLTNTQLFAAGAFSGIFTTTIMAPGERIKCLLQIQQGSSQQKYNGMVDCAKQLYKEGGIRSVYRGAFATLLRGNFL